MSKIVVVGGLVKCSHGGLAKLKSGTGKLTLGGTEVIVAGGEVGLSFLPPTSPPTPDNPAPCTKLANAGSPPPPSPCAATLVATEGVSTKMIVNGLGVLLDTASGKTTNPNDPTATWSITDAGQILMSEA